MSDASPTRIERELDQTRSRLGSHLNELQDRLSPGQVLDDLMSYFRGSEGAQFGRSLMDNVRGNPMPAAITAIGLAWLMASKPTTAAATSTTYTTGSQPYAGSDRDAILARVRAAEQATPRELNETDNSYTARLNNARGQAMGLARQAQETAESFGSRVGDALQSLQQTVSGAVSSLGSQASSAATTASSALSSLATSLSSAASHGTSAASGSAGRMASALTESPVLLGALGLAAGALLGSMLPVSEQEEAALGGIANQARDAASTLAREGVERGKQVAQAVAGAARDSAQSHGLAGGRSPGELVDAALSGDLAKHAAAVAQEVLQAGDQAVKQAVKPEGQA